MIDDHQLKPDITFTATHKDDKYGRESILRYVKAVDMAIAIHEITQSKVICEDCRGEIVRILYENCIDIDDILS